MQISNVLICVVRCSVFLFSLGVVVVFVLPFQLTVRDVYKKNDISAAGRSSQLQKISVMHLLCHLKPIFSQHWTTVNNGSHARFTSNNVSLPPNAHMSKKFFATQQCLAAIQQQNDTPTPSVNESDCFCMSTLYLVIVLACNACLALQYVCLTVVTVYRPFRSGDTLTMCQVSALCSICIFNSLIVLANGVMLLHQLFSDWVYGYNTLENPDKKLFYYAVPLTWHIGMSLCFVVVILCMLEGVFWICLLKSGGSKALNDKPKTKKSGEKSKEKDGSSGFASKRTNSSQSTSSSKKR